MGRRGESETEDERGWEGEERVRPRTERRDNEKIRGVGRTEERDRGQRGWEGERVRERTEGVGRRGESERDNEKIRG